MFYKITNEVPANTASNAAIWDKLRICQGTIKEYVVYGAPECADLCLFRVEYQGHQILPSNRGEWCNVFYPGVTIEEDLILKVAPFELDIYAYNDDTKHPHTYNLYVNILRDEPLTLPETDAGWLDRWRNLFPGGE